MTSLEWEQVREILYEASQMDAASRTIYLTARCGNDSALRGEVEELLAALEKSEGFLESPVSAEAQIGPYRILEEAGRGGMGIVYRALRDDPYRQIVAIKLVRSELSTRLLTDRLHIERQTLALLNHPNIARLLDGGATADGRPYLVMEWVEGRSILEYCCTLSLTVRQRLELFLQVCEALAHAHRNLVVHRDLKPSNILITADGQAKLLDFGIAKVFTEGESEGQATLTVSGARALTPEYASPEQVRQEPVTTATDIYSLGAVLYELLTGVQAHRIENPTPSAIERAVCTETQAPASSVSGLNGVPRKRLKGDLDNILAKALEKDVARRYRNVDEFAGDIRRHLDSQPVLARPASLVYRASRFARRNKLLVSSAAVVALALTVGLGVALWQAHRARVERAIAEQRFELARQLAGSVLYEFHDGIRDLQGSLSVQQLLLTRSLEYLEKLAGSAGKSPALERDLANGFERVASLAGSPGLENLGRDKLALESIRKALEMRKQVVASDPRSIPFRRELAQTERLFVSIQGISDSERMEHAAAALSLSEALHREAPGDQKTLSDLAVAEWGVGRVFVGRSRFDEAVVYYRRALEHVDGSGSLNEALYHKSLGSILVKTDDLRGALAEYQAAVRLDEPRVAANPADSRTRLDLSYAYSDIGLILRKMGQWQEGLAQYRKAYRIRDEVAAADPNDARAASSVGVTQWRIGWMLMEMGDLRQGERTIEEALQRFESYRVRFPEKRDGVELVANFTRDTGKVYQSKLGCAKARPKLERAMQLYRSAKNAAGIKATEEILALCVGR